MAQHRKLRCNTLLGDSRAKCVEFEEARLHDRNQLGITTTIIPLLRKDGRLHFEYPKPASVRLLEWTLVALWLLAPAAVFAALM